MKKWFDRCPACPAFMKRLWCQLAISYTLLTFCAMALLIVILYGIDDYKDFHEAIALERVEEQVISEYLTVAQAIQDTNTALWMEKAGNNIRKKLTSMDYSSKGNSVYRITNSSRPEVYIQISDKNDQVLVSNPTPLPARVAEEFAQHKDPNLPQISVTHLKEDGPIWVSMPIKNDNDDIIGRLRILYIAEFNLWIQFQSIIDFMLYTWGYVFLLSVPIGIVCGLVASRYVTKQLQRMNEVTESWRRGNFEPRIALPSDDVLTRHSQHLNDMAQDLEMYFNLKQNLAVSDERNRVARELHDTVKQKLFALGLQLATAKSKPPVMEAAGEHILEAETITREAQHDLMEIITQLRPAGTSDTSFFERIGMIADDFRRRFGVSIEFSRFDPAQLNTHAEHHVLRIVQEAFMNAVRHGKASKILIENKLDQDSVVITISDNGSGFNPDKKTGGFGITSMRDRVRDLPHGFFDIKSTAGAGTKITLSWKNGI
jgi:two-component system, NarL family, sensor histidine kinase LiaS